MLLICFVATVKVNKDEYIRPSPWVPSGRGREGGEGGGSGVVCADSGF